MSAPGNPDRAVLAVRLVRGIAVGLMVFALGSDLLGIGRPGFGERQSLMLIGGAVLLLATFLGTSSSDPGARNARFRAGYATAAVLLLNTLLALLLANLLVGIGFRLAEAAGGARPLGTGMGAPLLRVPLVRLAHVLGERLQRSRKPVLSLNDEQLGRIYPGLEREEVQALLAETWRRPLRFDPSTQFQEMPFRGRYVQVVEPGFRLSGEPAPWPMDPGVHNVWVFGGSTAFGYGLPDPETIPAFLQQSLRRKYPGTRIRVYNFGQAYFYSSQELALLQRLLSEGSPPPAVAVFLDGINEHQRRPFYSGYLERLARAPEAAFFGRPDGESFGQGEPAAERWLRNRQMIQGVCARFGIKPLFVWQPAPDWRYDLRFHPLWWTDAPKPPGDRPVLGDSPHYAALERLRAERPELFEPDVLWLADLQQGEQRPLYVDRLHYTAAFSFVIAEEIAGRIREGL